MKVSELTEILKKHGCYIIRHGKKHDIWQSPITGGKYSIPRHQSHETGNRLVREAFQALLGEES